MKKTPNINIQSFFHFTFYTCVIQETGQTEAQVPQSIHIDSSICLFPSSTSEIHDTGHEASQAPHAIQTSLSIL